MYLESSSVYLVLNLTPEKNVSFQFQSACDSYLLHKETNWECLGPYAVNKLCQGMQIFLLSQICDTTCVSLETILESTH